MSKRMTCALLTLVFMQTGITNSGISVTQRREGGILNVTCDLVGNETMNQINWEMLKGSNRTKLGTFHPIYGTHIPLEHGEGVEIWGTAGPPASSSLVLKKGAANESRVNESSLICCVFITFPSGILEQCTDTSIDTRAHGSTIASASSNTTAEAQVADSQAGQRQLWAVLAGGSLVSLLVLTLLLYCCWKHCCRRTRVFEVQRTFLTDEQTDAETYTQEELPVTPSHPETPQGFDPSKLYAKIKEDLYYGRLWRAYQGMARGWTQGPQPAPLPAPVPAPQIYYMLGENRETQIEERDSPQAPDTATMPPPENGGSV